MRIPLRSLLVVAIVFAAVTVAATRAHADVAPPDTCTSPGQPCSNAGPQYNAAGTCVATTCTKQVPAPDGGTMSMTYACNRCQTPDGGAGGGGGSGGGGGAGGSGTKPSGSSGCTVAATNRDAGDIPALLGALAVGLVLASTRRRRNAGE